MRKFTSAAIFILWLLLYQTNYCRAQKNNGTIQFIPKTFHQIKLSFDNNTIHQLTPNYSEPEVGEIY